MTLKLPDSLEPASVWTQLDLPWGTMAMAFSVKVTQPARPQRIVLHYRPDQKYQPSNNPTEHGRTRDVPMRLHFFVTRGLPDNSDLGYTTAVAVLTPWHIPETEWPRIVAESSSSDLIIPGNYRTASARVELGAAAVAVPFNLLTLATSVSTESAWNAAVATERALMPSALTLSPRHVASASNPSTGAAVAAQLTDSRRAHGRRAQRAAAQREERGGPRAAGAGHHPLQERRARHNHLALWQLPHAPAHLRPTVRRRGGQRHQREAAHLPLDGPGRRAGGRRQEAAAAGV